MDKNAHSCEKALKRCTELEEVQSRIVRLERSRIRERFLMAVVLAIIAGSAWLTGQSRGGHDIVQTQRLEILDEDGRLRAALEARDGISSLLLCDSKGVGRMALQVESNGDPRIGLNDEEGIGRALMALGGGRYPFMEFYDVTKTAEPKISMGIIRGGEAFLHVYDKKKGDYWSAAP